MEGFRLPVLLDVEGPLKLQVSLLVVIDELGHGVVVTTSHHARGCGLCLDCSGDVSLVTWCMCEERWNIHFFSYSGLSVVLGE